MRLKRLLRVSNGGWFAERFGLGPSSVYKMKKKG